MSVEQKTDKDDEIKRLEGLLIEDEIIMTSDSEEIAALKAALSELIPIAEQYMRTPTISVNDSYSRNGYKAVIDRAKKLLNKQSQSESDKTE